MERFARIAPPAGGTPRKRPEPARVSPDGFAAIAAHYATLYDNLRDGDLYETDPLPIVSDAERLACELKAAAYFLNASIAGTCALPPDGWYAGPRDPALQHGFAVVIAAEFGRPIDPPNPAAAWLKDADGAGADVRAAQIAAILAGYLRAMGVSARAHTPRRGDVDLDVLACRAGIAFRDGKGLLRNPFLGTRFALAAVTTAAALTDEFPLAGRPRPGVAYAFGMGGTAAGIERWLLSRRPSHLGALPMEDVRRAERPTTLILDDEIPQVSSRALFYSRAAHGDLGEKAQAEIFRFVRKHPLASAIRPVLDAAVPHQDGPIAGAPAPGTSDAAVNARAIKALCHHLGADIVGIGPAPRYAWYSHDKRGTRIAQHHATAIVLAIDQGQETLEGSSGDDWISGSQSSRAYMRGAEIAGLVARQIRALGHPARAHSNVDSQVLHTPLLLLAGVGELSRIGEVVLNPFLGPRFKSAVITTDMPLVHDKPIDFGLQDMCGGCRKCARECPCSAISAGDKVMFNGYEIWKPDVERCTRYRLTNAKGSSCGRCIKVCPFNKEGILAYRAALWAVIRLPWLRRWVPRLDDWLGHGLINPIKTWWSDLEVLGARRGPFRTVVPRKGTNRRGLTLGKDDRLRDSQKIAYYHASMMPPPNLPDPFPLDRDAGLVAAAALETPEQAQLRHDRGEPAPPHYRPPEPAAEAAVAGRSLISN